MFGAQRHTVRVHLFIDTNIFLSFYEFTKDDLEELKKSILKKAFAGEL